MSITTIITILSVIIAAFTALLPLLQEILKLFTQSE